MKLVHIKHNGEEIGFEYKQQTHSSRFFMLLRVIAVAGSYMIDKGKELESLQYILQSLLERIEERR